MLLIGQSHMWFTYIIQSLKDKKFYIGSTSDLDRRINQHNSGVNVSTRHRKPFKLVYSEIFATKSEAIHRELKLKSYKGGVAFKQLFKTRAGSEAVKRD